MQTGSIQPWMSWQKPITRSSRLTDRVERKNKLIELIDAIADRKRGETDNGQSREWADQANSAHTAESWLQCFRVLVNQKEREWSAIQAELRTIQSEPLFSRQPNQRCRHPIRRNSLPRGFNDRRSPLHCTSYTYLVT